MENGPFGSVFLRHTATSAAALAAWAVIAVCACALPRQAQALELASGDLAGSQYGWGTPVAAYAPKNQAVAASGSEPEKRRNWSIFHRDEKSTVSICYPQMDNVFIDNELAFWSDVRLRTFVSGVASLGEGNSRYGMKIDYSLSQASPRFVSVVFRISTETGGARPDLGLTTFTYDLENGAALSYADMFSDPAGLLDFFSEYARTELLPRLPRGDKALVMRGTAPNEANFAYFALRKDGLEIFFPPFQVDDSGLEEQSVIIPLERLAPYGPNLKIWGRKK